MKRRTKLGLTAGAGLCICLLVCFVLLLQGQFDRGRFQIVAFSSNGSNKMAMVARRSDGRAMSTDQIFVLIDNHVDSPAELRRAFHSDRPVFSAGGDNLSIVWSGAKELTILCAGCDIQRPYVAEKRDRDGDIAIRYVSFPASFYAE